MARLRAWDARADAAIIAVWREFWRLVRLGAAEVRACLRVDPALAAFGDRFLFGKHPRAVRLAVVTLVPLVCWFASRAIGLLFGFPIYKGTEEGSPLRKLGYLGCDILWGTFCLDFVFGFFVAFVARRAIGSMNWSNQAALVPGSDVALFRRLLAMVVWLGAAGCVLSHWYWNAYSHAVRGYGWGTPFMNSTSEKWLQEGSAAAMYLFALLEPMALFREVAAAFMWTTLATLLLLAFRRWLVGWFSWTVVWIFYGYCFSFFREMSPRRIFLDVVDGIESPVAQVVLRETAYDGSVAVLRTVLALAMVGWTKKHYDRLGPALAEPWR